MVLWRAAVRLVKRGGIFDRNPSDAVARLAATRSGGLNRTERRWVGVIPASINISQPGYLVWGAGTDIGKTLLCAALAYGAQKDKDALLYVKPVQTGFPLSSDSHKVAGLSGGSVTLGKHAGQIEGAKNVDSVDGSKVECHTLYAWQKPASPHLAAQNEGNLVSDHDVVHETAKTLHKAFWQGFQGLTVIETAGGVSSPTPEGSLQCEVFRALRLPCVLVGDSRLGGISATLTAYDSLIMRGYDVAAIVTMLDDDLDNAEYLSHNVKSHVHWQGGGRPFLTVLPELPKLENPGEEGGQGDDLGGWLEASRDAVGELRQNLMNYNVRWIENMRQMKEKSMAIFWWPFTQHGTMRKHDVTFFDSRYGESVGVFQEFPMEKTNDRERTKLINPQFDACASWWTQGLGAEVQPEFARAIAYATGRYGHLIFPENVNQATFECSKKLLETVGSRWAHRVFYSDNGSTAVEVALKMAFRRFMYRKRREIGRRDKYQLLGFHNSYHGDTLGAMEAQPESIFNQSQMPWFVTQGKFVHPPSLKFSKGKWWVHLPGDWPRDILDDFGGEGKKDRKLEVNSDNEPRLREKHSQLYADYLNRVIEDFEEKETKRGGNRTWIAACIIEPLVQGAGGMLMIDPTFQRALVKVCQNRGVSVIFDEVFTGFWRLGAVSGGELLGAYPDIACYAKLLTGGMVPMAATLANETVFQCFLGKTKEESLLHGHSYTAHPIGCVAACTAMDIMSNPEHNANLNIPSDSTPATVARTSITPPGLATPLSGHLSNLWDETLVTELSHHDRIESIVAIGTLFAATLVLPEGRGGYGSVEAKKVTDKLRGKGVFTRPLGNVVYLMVGPTTSPEVCKWMLMELRNVLDEGSRWG